MLWSHFGELLARMYALCFDTITKKSVSLHHTVFILPLPPLFGIHGYTVPRCTQCVYSLTFSTMVET